jgi:tetratricopeptide (TPR) repeat protein
MAACAAALLLMTATTFADENDEVAKLYKQGNLTKALEQANAYLAIKPKDAQMRFQKGLILTEQNRIADATRVFSSLSEDYPDLPEPFNNLAVLYASQGQYDKARVALEMAIRTHPSYSTAHENLGDIYAKMASQAYGKALQLDKANLAGQTRLAMIKDLTTTGKSKGVQSSAIAADNSLPTDPEKIAGKAPEKVPAKTAEKAAPEKAAPEKTAPEKTAPEKTTPEKAAPEKAAPEKAVIAEKPAPQKPAAPESGSNEVLKAVKAWAKAWSDKDAAKYLAFYASDFHTPRGTSRPAWEKTRRERIDKPKSIHVEITHPKISFTDATHARVIFRQSYHSDAIKSTTTKTLEMVKTGDEWLIQQERLSR